MGGRIAVLVLALLAAMPTSAWALAGGATGSGGGGGGGFSGGGGSSGFTGSDGSSSGKPGSTLLAVGIVVGVIVLTVLLVLLFSRKNRPGFQGSKSGAKRARKRAQKAEKVARSAQADDGYWDPDELKARVREVFFPVQESWSKRDVSESKPYVTDALYKRHAMQLDGLEKQHRVNRIEDLQLDEVDIVRVVNVTADDKDKFVAFIQCRARDWMESTKTRHVVNGNPQAQTTFQQYWTFVRSPHGTWVLSEIQQAEEGAYHVKAGDIDRDTGPPNPAARA
jgi:hypothetical protein